ncbi:hypothetical protein B0H10DRAFT_2223612 [Mycena sp. CBHHK59/15]|nr:hypothetical protein B0H10DRAFT_2223612 [Mycena sp. CBHHK59/15]
MFAVTPSRVVANTTPTPPLTESRHQALAPVTEYVVAKGRVLDRRLRRGVPRRSAARSPAAAKFTIFVSNVLTRAEVGVPVVLAALIYIRRAQPLERVFLGIVIAVSALCMGVFGKRDVGRIGR